MGHKTFLREVAKFASGLIVGDMLVGWYFAASGMLPINFMGIVFTANMVTAWALFDLGLLAVLVHYGWHADIHKPSIRQKTFFLVAGTIFSIVCILHFFRLAFGLSVIFGGWIVPTWLSWFGTVIAGYLGYSSLRFAIPHKK